MARLSSSNGSNCLLVGLQVHIRLRKQTTNILQSCNIAVT